MPKIAFRTLWDKSADYWPFTMKLIGDSTRVTMKDDRCTVMLVHLRPPWLHLFLFAQPSVRACISMSLYIPRTTSSDWLAASDRLSNLDFLSFRSDGAGEDGAGEDGVGEDGTGEAAAEALVPVSCPAEDARDLVRCCLRDIAESQLLGRKEIKRNAGTFLTRLSPQLAHKYCDVLLSQDGAAFTYMWNNQLQKNTELKPTHFTDVIRLEKMWDVKSLVLGCSAMTKMLLTDCKMCVFSASEHKLVNKWRIDIYIIYSQSDLDSGGSVPKSKCRSSRPFEHNATSCSLVSYA